MGMKADGEGAKWLKENFLICFWLLSELFNVLWGEKINQQRGDTTQTHIFLLTAYSVFLAFVQCSRKSVDQSLCIQLC